MRYTMWACSSISLTKITIAQVVKIKLMVPFCNPQKNRFPLNNAGNSTGS